MTSEEIYDLLKQHAKAYQQQEHWALALSSCRANWIKANFHQQKFFQDKLTQAHALCQQWTDTRYKLGKRLEELGVGIIEQD